jgi:hypothetical protein
MVGLESLGDSVLGGALEKLHSSANNAETLLAVSPHVQCRSYDQFGAIGLGSGVFPLWPGLGDRPFFVVIRICLSFCRNPKLTPCRVP